MKGVWFKRKFEKENEGLAGGARKAFRALDRGHKEPGWLCWPRVYSVAVGATAGFSELGGAEGSLLLAKLVLDCRGWRDAGTESLLGFLERRMRRLFVKATGMGHGKIQEGCFTHGWNSLFGLDCSQWHRVTETFEFMHLLLGQSSLEAQMELPVLEPF